MLQTGTLYSITNNENSVEIKQPIPNVFIYFSQNNARKLTAKTDSAGKFSFDLPLGSYQVTVSRGVEAPIYQIAGGAPFELTSSSKQNAFEQWVLAPVYLKPEGNPLVIMLQEIAKKANDSAVEAKKAEENAKIAMSDSWDIVNNTGYAPQKNADDFLAGEGGFVRSDWVENTPKTGLDLITKSQYGSNDLLQIGFPQRGVLEFYMRTKSASGWSRWFEFYHTANTTVDSNGFIKSASPIIRLFDDKIETNDQFKEAPVFEKIGVGTYKISNTLGLAKEGWTYEKPRGKDGNPCFHIKVDKLSDGCIISVHDVFEALEEATITDIDGNERKINRVVKILGEARDIKPYERWIDLRFHEEPEEIEEE